MDTADILQVPPVEVLGRIAARVGEPATKALRMLIAIANDADGGAIVEWLVAERLRRSNADAIRLELAQVAQRRASGEGA